MAHGTAALCSGTDYFIDTPARILIQVLVGIGPATRVALDRPRLCAAVSRTDPRAPRPHADGPAASPPLRATRAAAIVDADARLRGIERDLHDGPQARLVAVAMQLGEARVHLATGTESSIRRRPSLRPRTPPLKRLSPNCVKSSAAFTRRPLTPASRWRSKLWRPARRCRSPWRSIPRSRPTVFWTLRLQSLAYYCVAEFLANLAKHAEATTARVTCELEAPHVLRVRVEDDGRGGAVIVAPAAADCAPGSLAWPLASRQWTVHSQWRALPADLQW